jgi:hypothetical protein
MPSRSHTLQLPRPGSPPERKSRRRPRRRRRQARWRQAGFGLALLLAGCGLLALLLLLLTSRLDALLLFNAAIANLIRGLEQLGLALLQLLVMLLVVVLALLALLLLVGGAVRLVRAAWPGRSASPTVP